MTFKQVVVSSSLTQGTDLFLPPLILSHGIFFTLFSTCVTFCFEIILLLWMNRSCNKCKMQIVTIISTSDHDPSGSPCAHTYTQSCNKIIKNLTIFI